MRTQTYPEIIDGKVMKSLADAKAIQGVTILGQPGGWSILVRYGALERVIAAQRACKPRLWRNLNTAATFVRDELKLSRFDVDTENYNPEAIERRRPDQSQRLRQKEEAAEHDKWFRNEVQKALDGIADGSMQLISQEEHDKTWQKKRAELQARLK